MPDGHLHGDVAAVVVMASGKTFGGVCVDTTSWGICAERAALASMITAGEYTVQNVVAVCRLEGSGELYVLPPCGVCRKFMRQIDDANLDAKVILDDHRSISLAEMMREHG
jgi:cytidine deaminase